MVAFFIIVESPLRIGVAANDLVKGYTHAGAHAHGQTFRLDNSGAVVVLAVPSQPLGAGIGSEWRRRFRPQHAGCQVTDDCGVLGINERDFDIR
jgi:hypothetical protein